MSYTIDTYNWLNLLVLTLTLGAVVWYTVTNHRVLGELVKQRRLSVIPALQPEVVKSKGRDFLSITNIGSGVALNVIVADAPFGSNNLSGFYYRFDSALIIRPNTSVTLAYTEFLLDVPQTESNQLFHLKPEFAPSSVIITFRFQDIEGTEYEQYYQMGKGGNRHIAIRPKGVHSMLNINSRSFQILFLALVAVATLFPPFNWGEELLGTETERARLKARNSSLYQSIPIKDYSFLFADSKKKFLVSWGWNNERSESIPLYEALRRRIIIPELALEYFLAFLVAAIASSIPRRWLPDRLFRRTGHQDQGNTN